MAKRKKLELETNIEAASVHYELIDPEIVEENGIHPLSKLDGDIFYLLSEIIKKLDDDKELIDIIERYKSVPDDETYDLLVSYFESMNDKTKNVRYYIEIGEMVMSVAGLYSFTREESYQDGKMIYQITINRTQDLKVPYANTVIPFASEEYREIGFREIKEKLKKFSNIIFI